MMNNKLNTYCQRLLLLLTAAVLTSCEHEIDFTYPESQPLLVFQGGVSNIGTMVSIQRTRSMTDTKPQDLVTDAEVWIDCDDGTSERLEYDDELEYYRSLTGLQGTPGRTYHMRAIVDGKTYEGSSTMQPEAPIDTVFLRSFKVMEERIFMFSVKAVDPNPDERSFYWYRLLRNDEPFRWGCRSDRSSEKGWFEYDIICSSEREMTKDVDDSGKEPLHEGDELSLLIMTTDYTTYQYLQSLVTSERTSSNPISNITGGALGIFTTINITASDPIVFHKDEVPM